MTGEKRRLAEWPADCCEDWRIEKLWWEDIGEERACPTCGKVWYVSYDEYYDDETMEEWGYFTLEEPSG